MTGLAPVVRHYDHCASICGSAAAVVFPSSETDVRVAPAPYRTSSHYAESHTDVVRGAPRGHELTTPPLSSSLTPITNPTTTISDSSSWSSSPHQQVRQEAYRDGGDGNIGRSGDPTSQAPSNDSNSSSSYTGSSSGGDPRQLVRLRLFSLNDYLGLASHPEVAEAAARASKLVRNAVLVVLVHHTRVHIGRGDTCVWSGWKGWKRHYSRAFGLLRLDFGFGQVLSFTAPYVRMYFYRASYAGGHGPSQQCAGGGVHSQSPAAGGAAGGPEGVWSLLL